MKTLNEQISDVIQTEPVAVFMKGTPQMVMCGNSHRALLNRLHWMQKAYVLGERDRVLQKTPFSFDVSVWEFFWPLLEGAALRRAQTPMMLSRPAPWRRRTAASAVARASSSA